MSTQVPPSRLDSTKDFSSLVPSAFARANAAYEQANTASGAAVSSTPKISSIVYPGNDTAANTGGGQTVTLTGSGFNAGATVLINETYASVVSVANSTSLSFTTPANSSGTYPLYVVNTDGGTGISVPGISYSGTPAWSNTAGSLATVYETAALSTQLTATGDAAITYSVYSGTLPPGSSLNTSTGLLSGTTQATASLTTYTFTIRATDAQNQDTDRTFSITINPDVVTWSSPADGTSTALSQGVAMANVTLSATSAAGQSIAYTANALPTGVTISGSNVTGTPTVLGDTISVITATAANTNRTATRTFTWVVSVSSDAFFKNTTLLLNGEGTSANNGSNNNIFIDSSNNNFTITRNGNTSQGTFSPYSVTGWSNFFDGTGDYLTNTTNNTALAMGSGDFTIEFWMNATNGTIAIIFDNRTSTALGNNQGGMQIYHENGTIYFYGGANTAVSLCSSSVTYNTWNHVAIVRSGSGSGNVKMYINGALSSTYGSADTTNYSLGYLNIGTYRLNGTPATFYTGYISNFRLIKGTAVYTSAFTPSTTPFTPIANTSLLTCQSNRFIDNSPNSFTLTRNGDVSVQAFGPFGSIPEATPLSYSNYFDGTGDYLTLTSATTFNLTGDFTIEMWVYFNNFTSYQTPFAIASSTGGGENYIQSATSGGSTFTWGGFGGTNLNAGTFTASTWSHIAITRAGTALKTFKDGVNIASGTTSATIPTSGGTIIIGAQNSTQWFFNGYLSNIRVVKGTAVYTSDFTPSTTPLTAIANTSLLTCQSTTMVDNSTNNFAITAAGNVVPRIFNPFGYTAQSATSYTPSLHGGSAYFDGTGDYLYIPSPTVGFSLSTGDFTIECWVYKTSAVNAVLLDARVSAAAAPWVFVIDGSNFPYWYDGTVYTSTVAVTLNTWSHVAVVRTSGVLKIFVNGVQGYSASYGVNLDRGAGLVIGDTIHAAAPMLGYISNLRIIKGTAVYTTEFIPPAAPVIPITNTSLLLNFTNAGIIDQHGSNVIETLDSVQISTAVKKYNNASMYFDGTGDYLKIPSSSNFQFGTGNFTIESWLYPTAIDATASYIFDQRTADSQNVLAAYILPGRTIEIYVNGGVVASGGTIALNSWSHLAITRASNSLKMFLNGTQIGSTYSLTNTLITAPMYIGTRYNGTQYFNGYMDDFRITKGYARYTANFTAPTNALATK